MEPVNEKKEQYFPISGVTFIIIGILFLLSNYDIISLGSRWWALFFLIPISFLAQDIWRMRGKPLGGSFIGALTLTVIMLIFLLRLHWGVVWPVFIIIGGLAILLRMGEK